MTGAQEFCSLDVHRRHVMTGPQERFVPQHPLSLRNDRCTSIFGFQEVHRHHVVMTGTQEFLVWEGPPSSPDDRYTRTFCSTTSTLIVWWHVHMNFLFLKGPPVITWWKVHKNFCLERACPHCLHLLLYCVRDLTCFTVVKHTGVLEITTWHDDQSTVYERKYPCKNDDPSLWRQVRQDAVNDKRRVFQLEKEPWHKT